jgi:hypothetical protein
MTVRAHLSATAATLLLIMITLTGAFTAADRYTARAVQTPVQLAAANYSDLLPTLPELDTIGLFPGWPTSWEYSDGVALGNLGALGPEAWAPANPLFDFVAETIGTTQGGWLDLASLLGPCDTNAGLVPADPAAADPQGLISALSPDLSNVLSPIFTTLSPTLTADLSGVLSPSISDIAALSPTLSADLAGAFSPVVGDITLHLTFSLLSIVP